ncbi:MAG: RrF2 family transcriptional regulator [Myxococcota bacterium]
MRISTRVRYGTRALLELEYGENFPPKSIDQIVTEQKLAKKYLENLMNKLKKGGIIKSIRGKGGGYKLCCPPEKINLKDVYLALEGEKYLVECLDESYECPIREECVTLDVWEQINDAFFEIIEQYTVADLKKEKKIKESERANMFYI